MNKLPIAVSAIFCEDIRTEAGEQNTIIGTIPDNMAVDQIPGNLPKLCVYIRTTFDPGIPLRDYSVRLMYGEDREVARVEIPAAVIDRSISDTTRQGSPLANIITRIIAMPFVIDRAGQLQIIARNAGEDYIVGSLNVSVEGS